MSDENSQQLPDGRWVPAIPMGWQPGIDWEVSGAGPWEAVAYDEDVPIAVVRSRSKFWLNVKIARRHRKLRRAEGRL